MSDEKPDYKWPRYVLAGVVVFIVAAVVFMAIEIHKMEQERDFSAPIQTQ